MSLGFEELDLTYLNVDDVTSRRSILRADYGDGYADTAIVGAPGGRKVFQLSAGVHPDDESIATLHGKSVMEYYWNFFEERLDAGNEPFIIEWREKKWLVDCADPEYGVEVHTSDLFTPHGMTLNMRRVRGVDFNPDGSLAGPPVPTGLALEVLSDTEIRVTWDALPDTEAPTAPVLSSAIADNHTEITMTWAASTDNIGVTGYQTRIDGGSWTDRGNVLTYRYTGLSPSTEYDFEVRAYDAAGNFSDASNLISETTDAPPGWTPTDLPDLQHWYKASELVLSDNDPVGTWTDLNGVSNLTGAGSARPTYKANAGDPYVEFDGTDDKLTATTAGGGGWIDLAGCIIVEIVATGSDYERVFDSNNVALYTMSSGVMQFAELGTGPTEPMPSRPTGFMAVFFERDGTTGKIRLNGSETTATVGTSGMATTFLLGEYYGGGVNKNMRVKEVILCDNNLSGGDFALLATYINNTYGLTL